MMIVIFCDLYTEDKPSYHVHMKLFALLALACWPALAAAPQLAQVQNVYILPMGNAMDQYLANRLTAAGLFQIVADPKIADAILTDKIGESFEGKLDELYPPPPLPPKPKEIEAKKTDEKKTDAKKTDDDQAAPFAPAHDDSVRFSSFSRGKGTFFLVDRKTRNVLWSIYERPKNSNADELNRTAERVVNHLKKDLKTGRQPTS
jgi:hypothetical protein